MNRPAWSEDYARRRALEAQTVRRHLLLHPAGARLEELYDGVPLDPEAIVDALDYVRLRGFARRQFATRADRRDRAATWFAAVPDEAAAQREDKIIEATSAELADQTDGGLEEN